MTTESRMPSATELRIIHQFVDPHSTKNRTLEQILNEINDVNLIIKLIKHAISMTSGKTIPTAMSDWL